MADKTRYSKLQIGLHWLIAVLILATWWLGDGMGRALRSRMQENLNGFDGNTWHVWLGTAVLLLVVIRMIVRWMQGAPAPIAGQPPLMEKAGTWGHRLLYLLMFLAPAMGAVTWYLKIRAVGDPHALVANALMIVALGHALIALYHHYFLKDATLRRMTRGTAD